MTRLETRADGIGQRLGDIRDGIVRLENRLIAMAQKSLSKWDVVQVVVLVVGALMAAAIFGPRIAGFLTG